MSFAERLPIARPAHLGPDAGRFRQSWEPSSPSGPVFGHLLVEGCRGPPSSTADPPTRSRPRSRRLSRVPARGPPQHVRSPSRSRDADAMGEAGHVIVGIVGAEVIEEQERIEPIERPTAERARRREPPRRSRLGLEVVSSAVGSIGSRVSSRSDRGASTNPRRDPGPDQTGARSCH